MSEKTRQLKKEMILVYGEWCWINNMWLPFRKDKLTYHHILKKCLGGEVTWDNGSLLSREAHDFLHSLEYIDIKVYNDLNDLFRELNRTYKPPTEDYYNEVQHVLKKVKK